MDAKETITDIRSGTKELVSKIREFARMQKDLWQRVPYLALQADGRTGHNDQHGRAFGQGYWAIGASSERGCYTVCVDLETGELVSAFDPRKKASDEDVLRIAAAPDQIDAESVIAELRSEAMAPTVWYYKPEEKERWRKSKAERYGLRPDSYQRNIDPKEIHEANLVAGLAD